MNSPIIFLIDEDDDSRPSFRKILKNRGYHVSLAIDEEDALDRVKNGYFKADLILMNFVRKAPEKTLEIGRNISLAGNLDVPVVVIAHKYGADLEGKDIQISEKEYISYPEDGEQIYSLLSLLIPHAFDDQIAA